MANALRKAQQDATVSSRRENTQSEIMEAWLMGFQQAMEILGTDLDTPLPGKADKVDSEKLTRQLAVERIYEPADIYDLLINLAKMQREHIRDT